MAMRSKHPGEYVQEILDRHDISVTDAAAILRVNRTTLSLFLNTRADISGEMALRIEKAFGIKMETLMRMQALYDCEKTRKQTKGLGVRRCRRVSMAMA